MASWGASVTERDVRELLTCNCCALRREIMFTVYIDQCLSLTLHSGV
jgi:hypothetical protein